MSKLIRWNGKAALRVRARRLGFDLVQLGPSRWELRGYGITGRFGKLTGPRLRGGFPRTVSSFVECGERWPDWLDEHIRCVRRRRGL